MQNTRLQNIRIILIAILLLGTIVTLLRSFFVISDKPNKRVLNSFEFPSNIPLTGWQQTEKKSLKESQVYQYNNKQETVAVQSSYRQYDGGNTSRLLFKEASIPPATVVMAIKQQNDIGYYGIFTYQDRSYLTGCINRVGKSTLTDAQFTQNKYKYGWSPQRAALWLLGEQDFFETGCLWTVISIPTPDSNSVEQKYQTLETVWREWYRWWKPKL